MVYLGQAWSNPTEQTNKRIEFFTESGFADAAENYRAFSFPGETTTQQDKLVRSARAANPDLTQVQLESYARTAQAQQAISAAIIGGENARAHLPPLLVHRDAWTAYTEHCSEQAVGQTPPDWLMTEFLEPLGFDQAVVRGLRKDG